jgi:ferredoxin
MAKVTIDRKDCISCANCWTVCPAVFEQSKEDFKSQIAKKYRIKNDISIGETDKVIKGLKDAEQSCPVSIIRVKE